MRRSLLLLVVFLAPAILPAQTIRGTVVQDSTGLRVEGVLLTLIDKAGKEAEQSVRSDSAGAFVLRTREPGFYQIQANRIGMKSVLTRPFEVELKSIVDITVIVAQELNVLEPLVINETRPLTHGELMSHEGFEYRRRRLAGSFADTTDIRRSGYPPFSSLLKDFVPGIRTEEGWAGNEELRMQVGGDRSCQPTLYRDGRRQVTFALTILNAIRAQEFYGVEVYRKGSIPREFQQTGAECAVVAVWSRWSAIPPIS